jgi:hypothetical protein
MAGGFVNDVIILRAELGHDVRVKIYNLVQALVDQGPILYGMDYGALLEMRDQYLLHGGKLPITASSIRTFFAGHLGRSAV